MRSLLIPALIILTTLGVTASEVPYGHPDFYPDSDRPAQLRGDGTGQFPAATPVTRWDFRTRKNIVWAVTLPGWGYSSPIVVGDKVFVTCDWNKLICLDARSGTQLWCRDNHTFAHLGSDAAEIEKKWNDYVGEWLDGWQVVSEIAFLTWKLDVIATGKAGKPFVFPKGGYSGSGHAKKNGHMIAREHLTKGQLDKVVAQLGQLDEGTVQALRDRLAYLHTVRKAKAYAPQTTAYVPTLSPYSRRSDAESAYKERLKARVSAMTKYGMYTDFWNGWLSASFPTPASDGEHVYARWSQSQTVCYDFDGNRKWIVVHTEDSTGTRLDQSYSASPIIAGDKLIVMFGGKVTASKTEDTSWTRIRALDKKTGAEIWSRKLQFAASSHAFPQVMRVKHGEVDALATTAGHILNTADGAILAKGIPSSIAPPLADQNKVYYISGTSQSTGDGIRMKFELTGGAKPSAKAVWIHAPDKSKQGSWLQYAKQNFPNATIHSFSRQDGVFSNVGGILHDGKVLYGNNPTSAITASDGSVVSKLGKNDYKALEWPAGATGEGRGHLVRAGGVLINTCQNTVVRVQSLDNPKQVVGIGHCGSEYHRAIQLLEMTTDEAAQAVRALPWLPTMQSWAPMQTTVWPQGNRLYIRTKDSLYCIGDPKVAYHSPAGAPESAKTQ